MKRRDGAGWTAGAGRGAGVPPRRLSRFVALGDSFTEGLADSYEDGRARGWADRVADVLAGTEPDFCYANLALRGLRIDAILAEQVPAAVAWRPDLVTVAAGGNDLLGLRSDVRHVAAQFDRALAALAGTGAVTLVFTGFDPRAQLPVGRLLAGRTAAYNAAIRRSARRHGALLVDLWHCPELTDPRLWSADRLHLSPLGHRHVAALVLARLGRPVPHSWAATAPADTPASRVRAGVAALGWSYHHLRPWAVRRLTGRSTADGRAPKYPEPVPWAPGQLPSAALR